MRTRRHFAAKGPALKRSIVHRRAQQAPDEDPLADAFARNVLAYLDDTTTNVRTLDTRKLQRRTRPRTVRVVDRVITPHPALAGLIDDGLRVPPDPRVHVRVVDASGRHLDQHLTLLGQRHRHVRPVLEFLQPTVAGEENSGHGPRQQDRVPPLGGDAGAYHCCVTRRAGRTTAGSSIRAEPIRTLDGNQRRSTPFADETAISPPSWWSPLRSGRSARCARPPLSAPRHPRRRSRPARRRTRPGSGHARFPPAA